MFCFFLFFFFFCLFCFPEAQVAPKFYLLLFSSAFYTQQSCLRSTPASLLIILWSFMPSLPAVATQDEGGFIPSPSFPFLVTDLSRKFLLSDLQGSCGQYNEHFPRPHSPWSFCRTSRRFCKLHQVTHPSFNPCWFPKAFLTFQTTPIHSLYQVLLLCAKLNFEDFLNFQS